MAFVKLDTAILESTLWIDRAARDIFITALLMAEPREITKPMPQYYADRIEQTGFSVPPGWYGFVAAAGVGIARRAFVEQDEAMMALETLGSTDPHSRSPEFGGRRLVRVDGGITGWRRVTASDLRTSTENSRFIVLNFFKYRDKDYTAAERMAKLRARRKAQEVTANSDAVTRNSDAADADADADAEEENQKPLAHSPNEREGVDSVDVSPGDAPKSKNLTAAKRAPLVANLYSRYPRKVAKADAFKVIEKAIILVAKRDFPGDEKAAADWLGSRVDLYARSSQAHQSDKSKVPYPASWFNAARYDDDEAEWSYAGSTSGKSRFQCQGEAASESPSDGFEDILARPVPAWVGSTSR
jgi:hypothetical protein